MLLFVIDRKQCLNNSFSLLHFLTLKLLQLFFYVNGTEKKYLFSQNTQKEIQSAVLFAQVELPGGRILFGLESLLCSTRKKNWG